MSKVIIAIAQLTGGGAERVASVWANELQRQGHDVTVLVFMRSADEYALDDAVTTRSVAPSCEEYLKLSFVQRFRLLRECLKDIQPQVLISFLPTTQIWMMLASVGLPHKRVETIRVNPWTIQMRNLVFQWLWKRCYHTADGIIVQTTDQKPFFSSKDQKKCTVIPNPISEVFMDCVRPQHSGEAVRFIAAGRIDQQKNYEMMICGFAVVCAKHPNITLDIFGAGRADYVSVLEDLIVSLEMQDHIFLRGRTTRIEKEYSTRDVFLMTSDYEGMPNALAEAMASKLVCISTDCLTGPRDLIDHSRNGYLIPVGDVSALSDTIEHVIAMSPEEKQRIANAARDKVTAYCSKETSIQRLDCAITAIENQ